MFDIGFSRIVWKEFRTQSQVWGALVCGALLLQVLFYVFGRDFQLDMPNYPLEVALVLTACYGLTSAAILYAGEREERTDELLQQLPLPPGRLLWGKLTFTVISLLAFALVVFAAGYIIKVAVPPGVTSISEWWGAHAIGFLQGAAGLILWGLFYSLLLSRVMAVLFAAVATQLLVAFVFGNFLPGPFEAWQLGIGVIVAAADLWLARHWLSGRSVVPVFEGNRATTDRRSRFWLRSLTRAADLTPLSVRTAAVLLWRELRTAVPFAIAWGLLGILMVDLLMRGRSGPWNVMWICATPLVCGLFTCLGDNWRQTFRFLTDRGISPLIVWLTKHAVWFALALGLVLLLGVWDIATSDRMQGLLVTQRVSDLTAWERLGALRFRQWGQDVLEMFRSEMALRHVSLVTSLGLSLYLVGHLCSLWFRRVAVAVGVGLVAGILLTAWHGLVATADIPNLYATWPLTLALLAASLLTVGGWMHEKAGWRYTLQRFAWIAVPVVGVMLASLWYRAHQIPAVALDFDWKGTLADMQRSDSGWTARWRTVLGNVEMLVGNNAATFAEHQNHWLQQDLGITPPEDAPPEAAPDEGAAQDQPPAQDTLPEFKRPVLPTAAAADDSARSEDEAPNEVFGFEPMGMGAGGMSGMSMMAGDAERPYYNPWDHLLEDEPTQATIDQLIALAAELETKSPWINPSIWTTQTTYWLQRVSLIGNVLAAAAQQHAAAGDLDEAWKALHAGLVLTDYLQRQVVNPIDLQGTWNARATILQQIHAWAAHPDQTRERLQTSREAVAQGRILPPAEEFVQHQYAWERHLLESNETFSALLRPAERERAERLMSVITTGQRQQLQHGIRSVTDDPLLNWPAVSPDITEQHIERWTATTPWLRNTSFGSQGFQDIRPVVATQSATLLVLDLQAWRIEHGEFPQTLRELAADTEFKVLPRDPYTGTNFGYAPQGFPAPALIVGSSGYSEVFVVPTNTPLLWSRGHLNGDILHSTAGDFYRAVPFVADDQSPSGPASRAAAAQDTTRLLFVILGRSPWY